MTDKTWTLPDGVYTALVTPLRDGALDRDAWRRLVGRQIAGGVAGIVPAGSTGEGATLTAAEREWLVRECVALTRGRCAVIAGAGTNATATTIEAVRAVRDWGADAAMVVTPYYNKPQQHGLLAHFRAVARAVELPLVVYNVPGRTGVNLLPATAALLSTEPNVVALKEASGNLDQIEEAIERCNLKVLSGDDGLNFPIWGRGGRGTISVVSNLLPGTVARMWRAWTAGDVGQAWSLSRALDPVVKACFLESNPVPVKELLHLAGLCAREPRLPLATVAPPTAERLAAFFHDTLAPLLARDGEAPA